MQRGKRMTSNSAWPGKTNYEKNAEKGEDGNVARSVDKRRRRKHRERETDKNVNAVKGNMIRRTEGKDAPRRKLENVKEEVVRRTTTAECGRRNSWMLEKVRLPLLCESSKGHYCDVPSLAVRCYNCSQRDNYK